MNPDDPLEQLKALRAQQGDGSSDPLEQLKALKAPRAPAPAGDKPSAVGAGISGAAQGATFGFADEILGGIDAANTLLPKALGGEGASLSDLPKNYARGRDKVRSFDTQAGKAHGTAHLVGMLAGGLAPIVASGGAGEGAGLASALKQGAAYGTIQGAGAAKSLRDTPEDALLGGAVGAAGGGVLHGLAAGGSALAKSLGVPDFISKTATAAADDLPVGKKLSGLLRNVGASTGRAGTANKTMGQSLTNEGATPQSVLTRLQQNVATSGEKPELLADYSPELLKTTKSLTKQPGAARAKVVQAIRARDAGTRGRVLSDLGGGSIPQDVRPDLESMVRSRSASAERLFPKASGQVIDDPGVTEILSRPTFAALWQDARRLAADEGRALPTTISHELHPAAAQMLSQASPADQSTLLAKLIESGAATEVEKPVPDVQTIAYIEKALKDKITTGFGGARGAGHNEAAILQKGFQDLRSRVADLSPEYDAALTDFAARSKPIDATTLGLNLSKYTGPNSSRIPRQAMGAGDPLALKASRTGVAGLEHALGNMEPSTQGAFRKGALTNVVEGANRVPTDAQGSTNSVLRRSFADSPDAARVRSLLFGSSDELGTFEHGLGRERLMASTSAQLKGSDTAENLAEQDARKVTSVLSHLIHPIRGVRALAGHLDRTQSDALNAALGERLSATGSQGIESVLRDVLRGTGADNFYRQIGNATRNDLATQRGGL